MTDWWRPISIATRTLRRSWTFSLVVVCILAIAMGMNATILMLTDRLLFFAPIGVDSTRLVKVSNSWILTPEQYAAVVQGIRSLAITGQSVPVAATLGEPPDALPIQVRFVTSNYFAVLGSAVVGPGFHAGAATGELEAIISRRLSRDLFGSDSRAVGSVLRVSRRPYTVTGIAPEGFTGIDRDRVDVWLAVDPSPRAVDIPWPTGGLWLVGRLSPDASLAQAEAELINVHPADAPVMASGAGTPQPALAPVYEDFRTRVGRLDRAVLYLVFAGISLLLIACANVSGLLLNRLIQRRYDLALRIHLGATPSALARELTAELAILSLLAAVAATYVGYLLSFVVADTIVAPVPDRPVASLFPALMHRLELRYGGAGLLNGRILAATAVVAAASMAACLVAPLLHLRPSTLSHSLNLQDAPLAGRRHLRDLLIALQVALTVVLIVTTSVFARSLRNASEVSQGVDTDRVIVATVDVSRAGYSAHEVTELFRDMVEAIRATPQVMRVSVTSALPMGRLNRQYIAFEIPGHESPYGMGRPAGQIGPFVDAVSPGYFATLGMRVLQGRDFTADDTLGREPVVIVNDRLARDYFRGARPLGQCVYFWIDFAAPGLRQPNLCRRVIGVVTSVRTEVVRIAAEAGNDDPALYVPTDQWGGGGGHILIKTATDPGPLMGTIRAQLQTAASRTPFVKVERLSVYHDQQIHGWRVASVLFGAFASVGLPLAAVAIFTAVALTVRERRREMGIRVALGASPGELLRALVIRGIVPAAVGVTVGLPAAILNTRLLAGMLYGIESTDVPSALGAAALMMFAAGLACIVPARQILREDPARALRYD